MRWTSASSGSPTARSRRTSTTSGRGRPGRGARTDRWLLRLGGGLGGPLLLVGGGSGVVPLMAMLRARERPADRTPALLLASSRTTRSHLPRGAGRPAAEPGGFDRLHTLTRGSRPAGTATTGASTSRCWPRSSTASGAPRGSAGLRVRSDPAGRGRPTGWPRWGCRRSGSGPSASGRPHETGRDRRPLVLDANAVAGDLREIMGVEIPTMSRAAPIAGTARVRHAASLDPWAGVVLRYVICGEIVIRWVRHPDGPRVDMRGAAFLQPGVA